MAALINTFLKMGNDAIITVNTRLSLDARHEMCVTILELTCSWNQKHSLKVYAALIPTRFHLV